MTEGIEVTTDIRIIAGLGNPGSDYFGTRHNVGFEVIDLLAEHFGVKFRRKYKSRIFDIENDGVKRFLQKPMTYMNLSGKSIRSLLSKERLKPSQVLVVYDDLALPLGRMRIRKEGGAGGHNGIKSIISELGCQEFPRMRIGIGPAPSGDTADFVLERFQEDEQEKIKLMYKHAVEAILMLLDSDLEAVMNHYNGLSVDDDSEITESGEIN